ncbi:MAG: tripartite tricarboxylate transporter substrate binding protein [Bradyrhizobium sp.]
MSLLSRRRVLGQAAGAAAWAAVSSGASAEPYPSRRIRLVIPYAAGASGDQIGRPWAEKVTELLGPVYVENIAGAGGAIGCAAVAREAPDGYSLLLGTVSTHVLVPLASAHLAYDPIADFRAIYRLISTALAFVVHPSLPVRNLQELVTYAKANPGQLSYGTPGIGTGNHLVGELFRQQGGIADMVHVPYRGMALATNDLIGGQITMMISVVSAPLLQLSRAGNLRILAVTSERRLHGAPELPTAIEAGMPDLRYDGWFGLFAAKATADEIVERIAQTTRAAMADPALQDSYRSQGLEPDTTSSPDSFSRLVEDEYARMAPIIRSIGLSQN